MNVSPAYSVCPVELAWVLNGMGLEIECARYWHEGQDLVWQLQHERKSEEDLPAPTAEELGDLIPDYLEIDFPEGAQRGFLSIHRIVRGAAPPRKISPSGGVRIPIRIAERAEGRNWEVCYLEGRYENGEPVITDPDQLLIVVTGDVLASAFVKLLMVLLVQMPDEGIQWRSLDPLSGAEIPKPATKPRAAKPGTE
jgi:hypothetical protein